MYTYTQTVVVLKMEEIPLVLHILLTLTDKILFYFKYITLLSGLSWKS